MSVAALEQPKRGYLAQVLTIPPLVYPFQYNPTQITDSKKNEWKKREPNPNATLAADVAAFRTGFFAGAGQTLSTATELLGRTFSGAELKMLEKEGDRTVNFKFVVDGREQRPGEPARRRNDAGDIVGDLSVLRSFVYPQLASDLDMLSAITNPSGGTTWSNLWFNHPPSVVLVLGGMSMEGFIQELKITETLFNADLDPTRAEVEVTMIEKIDSLSFVLDAIKRLGRSFYYTAYEDIGKVLF